MKRVFILITAVISIVGTLGISGCKEVSNFFETEVHITVDGLRYVHWYPQDGDYYASDIYEDDKNLIKEAQFIAREINGIPVQCLGVAPFMSVSATPIVSYSDTKEIHNVYCPGSIEECISDYFDTYYINQPEIGFHIYYCGTVTNLSLLGEGEGIVYYVPYEQLEEYSSLWEESEANGNLKAANVEYHLNADDTEKYYYIDYVEDGETIKNIPPEPTREGYDFVGWYLDENGTQVWDFDTPVTREETESLTLFAKWQEK